MNVLFIVNKLDPAEMMRKGYYYIYEILLPDNREIHGVTSDIVDVFDSVFASEFRFVHIYWGMRPV